MNDQQPTKQLAVSNYDKIRALVKAQDTIARFADVLGDVQLANAHLNEALMAVMQNADLMECTPISVINGVMRTATMRLSLEPSLGQAYLVPFNDRQKGKVATLVVGWKGIKQLAMRTGQYRFIQTSELYEGQTLEVNQLTGQVALKGMRKSNKVVGYFNFFELKSGYQSVLYMTNEELLAHGARYSKTFNFQSSKWKTDFESMAKKTVTRLNLLRNGYIETTARAVLESMNDDAGDESQVVDVQFSDDDVERAIEQEQTETADKPKRSSAEVLSQLVMDEEPEKVDAPMPAPKGATNGKPERPMIPATLRKTLESKARKIGDVVVNNDHKGAVAACLDTILGGSAARHFWLEWMIGRPSLSNATGAQIEALYAWLKPSYDQETKQYIPDAVAITEAQDAMKEAESLGERMTEEQYDELLNQVEGK